MTDKIREAFEKWKASQDIEDSPQYVDFKAGFLAGRQSMLDELEQVGSLPISLTEMIPIYRLPEGVTK